MYADDLFVSATATQRCAPWEVGVPGPKSHDCRRRESSIVRSGCVFARPGSVLCLASSAEYGDRTGRPTSTATASSTSELTLMSTMIQKS